MDTDAFLDELRSSAGYRDQIVYVREVAPREALFADPAEPLAEPIRRMLQSRGIERLYAHQAEAIDAAAAGRDVLVATCTASGKSLCYQVPILRMLLADRAARALLVFPTKALCQDQFRALDSSLGSAGMANVLAGVYDGDTPPALRRRLRDSGAVILTNPDMLHAALMPQHGRWAEFLGRLRILVLDEMHVYSGIFGSNMANLLRRFWRVCRHYGSRPQILAGSATIGNPGELARKLTGREMFLIDRDASGRGRRTYVFWNPPRIRRGNWRSRRSANVEAHELMAALIERGAPTITFSKAKMTAEMIHRYVREKLSRTAPRLADRVTPYRGGYLPAERREIERRLFDGELLGVSATRALELGIDVGTLAACILVGYPGTLARFFQQSGRAGRRQADSLVVLVGLDTSINQYIMTNPEYLFGRCVERGVIDADNPFVTLGHLRCAAHELPLEATEAEVFGRRARAALAVLAENQKLRRIDGTWYHSSPQTPQHEVSLRDYAEANVLIEDAETGAVLGNVNRFDAPPILHPGAVYMHRGQTHLVEKLDLDENVATVRRADVDYYTQPLGGTDVHHVDERLLEKAFGTGAAYWGEVTAYFRTWAFEKVHFYSLDALAMETLDLPTMVLETLAVWLVPPEELMERVRAAGLNAHGGLRGIGYATRMLLPLFMTCDTLDFSHSIGSANSEWNAVFIYERYPLGLGFSLKAYRLLHLIVPAVLDSIRNCPCDDGCPCCVGKPLRPYSTWNVERGEGAIPSKASAVMILEGLLGDGSNLENPDTCAATDGGEARDIRLRRGLRRRLERMRQGQVFHPIRPQPATGYPPIEQANDLEGADTEARRRTRVDFHKKLTRRLAKHIETDELDTHAVRRRAPEGMRRRGANKPPTHFPGRPAVAAETVGENADIAKPQADKNAVQLGDSIAAKARRIMRNRGSS